MLWKLIGGYDVKVRKFTNLFRKKEKMEKKEKKAKKIKNKKVRFAFKRLRTKILFAFFAVMALVVAYTAYNYITLTIANKDTNAIIEDDLKMLDVTQNLAFNISQRVALARGYVLYGDAYYKTEFYEYTTESTELQNYLLEHANTEEVTQLVNKSIAWRQLVGDSVFTEFDRNNVDAAINILQSDVEPLARELIAGFEELSTSLQTAMDEKGKAILLNNNVNISISSIISIVVVAAGIVIALITASRIAKPVRSTMKRLQAIAQGDLSGEPLEIKLKDEIGELIAATNQMNDSMRDIMQKINEVSSSVSSHSKQLNQSADEVRQGSEQVASTMEEIAAGSESQANTASNLSAAMITFSEKIQEASENGKVVYEASNEVLDMTEDGSTLMQRSVDQMGNIDQIVKDAVKKVQGLDSQTQQIDKIVKVIMEIADQTNLLALNAAIEAARAGEQGRGFAVVANEVRKLAEEVSNSITDITKIVGTIMNETDDVVKSLEKGYKEVEKGSEYIHTTDQTFKSINNAVQNMAVNIDTVVKNLHSLVENGEKMNAGIEEIASITEEAAAGVEETSASAEETSSSMEEVARSANELAHLAEELNTLVKKFKL
jgi:methyl-accepting chemotaxis protein